ncbi:FG-GAP-like repeat-containing protein [Nocardioides sp.]|uniref:FG-GAP-like repeat-containing protein n=1 Tax=Nocardioides sp. TaxID=35761 RepID=UPI0027170DA1|nr:FG-GAP-like repeat-containing protein [Nocardioides sp.]MDO9456868.1 FG-GAP-like repeat-containing protein [Nocardioides sp.]
MPFFPPSDAPSDGPPGPPRTRDVRPRFVTTCQQLLVLGVILAALTPAARIVSIDFGPAPERGDAPVGAGAAGTLPPASMAAYAAAQTVPSLVPTAVVDPTVREVSLTPPAGARIAPGALATARAKVVANGGQRLVSTPQRVTGYGAVGLTWQHGDVVPDDQIKIKVRLKDGGRWSGWTRMDYHDDHGPDPDSEEGRRARPGTDELLVGDVDEVQVKVVSKRRSAPADMKLAVIDPGVAATSAKQLPAIDTATLPSSKDAVPAVAAPSAPSAPAAQSTSAGDVQLAAATYTPKPTIYSRKQWGADERMRDKSSLHYFEVHAGFVHHTVNANNYKADDVPAILRGIYAYHTKSRGWSDVGYNYLVDRFGRIWEGRYGGVDRPVVGAHTLGYNDDSFAMSAIGNFEETQPSSAMIQAYGALFAWKLSLHGVDASSTKQYVTSKYFKAVNGHRDAASTACPGKYLYAKIPQIRTLAAQAQKGFAGRQLESNVAGVAQPDLIVRRTSDGQGFVIPLRKTATGYVRGTPIATGIDLSTQNRILNAGDWNRDGKTDLISRRTSTGTLYLRPGLGNGKFGEAIELATGFGKVGLLAAVGDMTGDGWPDLMGQPSGGAMRIYPGRGAKGLAASYVAYSAVPGTQQIPVGLWDGDGAPDVIARNGSKLTLYPGNGPGGLTGARALSFDATPYDAFIGVSDMDLTGHPDLLARKRSTGQLVLIPGTTTGFGKPVVVGSGYGSFNLFG